MGKLINIDVTGDAYLALFFLRPGEVSFDGQVSNRAYAHIMPVGAEYIYRAVRAACDPWLLLSPEAQEADKKAAAKAKAKAEAEAKAKAEEARKAASTTGGAAEPVKDTPSSAGDPATVSSEPQAAEPARNPSPSSITVRLQAGDAPFQAEKSFKTTAIYELRRVAGKADCGDPPDDQPPMLQLADPETQEVVLPKELLWTVWSEGYGKSDATADPSAPPPATAREPKSRVLVHWFGELADKDREKPPHGRKDEPCAVHIQVGLATVKKREPIRPAQLASPELARIIVANIGEISSAQRVRKSLSYEAIAVDLLRYLRGDRATPKSDTQSLLDLSMSGDGAARLSILAVRINNAAVFLYACRASKKPSGPAATEPEKTKDFQEIGAWLICHKQECAPLSQPEVGQMVGFIGFVSAQIAAAVGRCLSDKNPSDPADLIPDVIRGVKRSLAWQRVSFERGYGRMLFKQEEDGEKKRWQLIPARMTNERNGYDEMFADVVSVLCKKHAGKLAAGSEPDYDKETLEIKVQIARAVAHRIQWFMARSVVQPQPQLGEEVDDVTLGKKFFEVARRWLSKDPEGVAIIDPKESNIPIVRIGDAQLTDRREVEDYLAIQQALHAYTSADQAKPLSVAIFGSPGSGKSFAVRQVVKHLGGENRRRRFKTQPLTFNLGQFKTLDELPAALHLVRNECLSSEIPIVFFDEFDSTFQGQPFGWLKYFLAPMQDGEFYHDGQNYRMGRAVFVFAGGVNRSFEEFNGRLRNPGFCEAKGPDFISRLKAHLNVQGINNPEDETDQHRYILRRGIMLRDIVRRRMGLSDKQKVDELLHPSVARALLNIKRFKHGVRSLEAIIAMCAVRPGFPIGPSDLPSLAQLEMHVDAVNLLRYIDEDSDESANTKKLASAAQPHSPPAGAQGASASGPL